nr:MULTISPECIES: hypothetical protein [unclassified Dolichospermum]
MSISFPTHAQAHLTQVKEPDLHTQSQTYGLKPSGVSALASPNLSLLSNLKDSSIEDYERALEDSEWQDTLQKLKLSRHRSLERRTFVKGYSLLPTLTTYPCSNGKGGNAGANKLERILKEQGRLESDSEALLQAVRKLSVKAALWKMGFPSGYLDCLIQGGGKRITPH